VNSWRWPRLEPLRWSTTTFIPSRWYHRGTRPRQFPFDRAGLVDFNDRHYTPDRIVVALAGNVDHDRAVRLIEKEFSVSDRGSGAREVVAVPEYSPTTISRERPIQQAHLVLGTRGYDVHDPRRVALSVYNTILGGGMSSRLNQNIRERYGYCYSIYSFVNMHSDTGDLGVYMGTDASKVEHAEKLIRREFDKLRQKPVGRRVIDRARSQVKGSIMLGLESMGSRMMRIGRQELYYNRYFSLDEILEMVDAIEPDDVLEVANDNEPAQVVLSGHKVACDRVPAIAKERGVRRALPLPVSAPFHCSLMKPAADVMGAALANTMIAEPDVPVVANVTAGATRDPDEIQRNLVAQVTGTVRWRECVLALKAEGVTTYVEVGAGKVLSGLVRRIDGDAVTRTIGSPDDVKAVTEALKG